jgi:hypothetical protein
MNNSKKLFVLYLTGVGISVVLGSYLIGFGRGYLRGLLGDASRSSNTWVRGENFFDPIVHSYLVIALALLSLAIRSARSDRKEGILTDLFLLGVAIVGSSVIFWWKYRFFDWIHESDAYNPFYHSLAYGLIGDLCILAIIIAAAVLQIRNKN